MLTILERLVEREETRRFCSHGASANKQWRRPFRTYYQVRCGCGRIFRVRADNFKRTRTCKFCWPRTSSDDVKRKIGEANRLPLVVYLGRVLEQIRTVPLFFPRCEIETIPRRVCVICHNGFFPNAPTQKVCGWYCKTLHRKRRPLPKRLQVAPVIRAKPTIRPEAILERDNWICQICFFPAPKHLRGTFSSIAPEVGHIIPHAEGGDYVPENLQCEHRGCNLEKNFHDPHQSTHPF